jgi:1-phosphatidylinositol phosphodiesterase
MEGAGWCINAETWADNTPNATCPSGDICVQDFYEVMDTGTSTRSYSSPKLTSSELRNASAPARCNHPRRGPSKQPFYINFLSAVISGKSGAGPRGLP